MNKQKLIDYLRRNAIITLETSQEDTPVRGNALASENESVDKKAEDEIIERLNDGDISAWFCAKVTARWDDFEGVDFLGCCSYASLEEFKEPGHYYDDMVDAAVDDLATQILAQASALKTLERKISCELPKDAAELQEQAEAER